MKDRILAALTALYNFFGDVRTKNALLVVLLLLTAFGMVAPETATSMRDTILALVT